MATHTTLSSAKAWAPDVQAFSATDAIPDALIFRAATVVLDNLEGDGPAARVPWVDDTEADFYAEGSTIAESDPDLAETVIYTRKLAKLLKISREQYHQDRAAQILSHSTQRAITVAANQAFLSLEPEGDYQLTGLLNTPDVPTVEPITEHLDPVADLIGEIEAANGQPSVILANPRAWAKIRKLRTGTGFNSSLIGAGVQSEERRLMGLPVLNSPAVPDDQMIVVDPTAIAAAVGPVQISSSEEVFFASDSIGLRCTWRFGWAVKHPDRLGIIPVELTDGDL